MGTYRTGKSFLLAFLTRFLQFRVQQLAIEEERRCAEEKAERQRAEEARRAAYSNSANGAVGNG